ncbi:uncharacterized protein NPIL_135511 [Nephila pilipes]|uniref:Uncharacterized protein n=1 Tax=Nephila pilipes TaxID=299642 RepID=A0A8X6N725_NEPPI|nr:uncharacterized protein NPIL_135511 [Nephila pilipes]
MEKPQENRGSEKESGSKAVRSFMPCSIHNMNMESSDSDSNIKVCENADFLQTEMEAIEKISGVIKDVNILIVGDSGTGKLSLASTFTPFPRKKASRYTKTVVDLAQVLGKSRCYVGLHIFCAPFRSGDDECFVRDPLENPLYDLVIFLFDLNLPSTMDSISRKWNPEVNRYLSKRLPVKILVGNQLDTVFYCETTSTFHKGRQVYFESGLDCSKEIRAEDYFEVSALAGRNIEPLMKKVLSLVCK